MKRVLAIPSIVLVLVLAVACPAAKQQQVAQAAQNASIVIKGFQQGEIVAYQSGAIPQGDHIVIQESLVTLAKMGKTVDGCILAATTTVAEVACIDAAISTIDLVQADAALHLKSERAKTDFQIALIGTRTALSVITTIIGGGK